MMARKGKFNLERYFNKYWYRENISCLLWYFLSILPSPTHTLHSGQQRLLKHTKPVGSMIQVCTRMLLHLPGTKLEQHRSFGVEMVKRNDLRTDHRKRDDVKRNKKRCAVMLTDVEVSSPLLYSLRPSWRCRLDFLGGSDFCSLIRWSL